MTSFIIDSTPPELTEIHPILTPGNDSTPSYTFSSSEEGALTYSGDCSSTTTSVAVGNNLVTFDILPDGIHNNCSIMITDRV